MANSLVPAVLCGDLNMIRCLDRTGIPIIHVSTALDNPAAYSRCPRSKHLIANPRANPQATLQALLQIGRACGARPVLYYGDDTMLLLVSRNRQTLSQVYRFLLPDEEMVEDLANKLRFAGLAQRLSLPVPRALLASEAASPLEIERRVGLPCVLKPNTHVGWFTSPLVMATGGQPHKVLVVKESEELRELYRRMKEQLGDFVVQEYIPGDDTQIYSFHGYFDRNSRLLAHYVGRKVRTYPRYSGISTCLELVDDPEVVRVGIEILRKLNYVGVVKIDFKKDTRTNRLLMLEVNTRFSLWNHLGAACGINLLRVAYDDLAGRPQAPVRGYRTGVRWLAFADDLRGVVADWRARRFSIVEYARSLATTKVYDVFCWHDLVPWVVSTMGWCLAVARSVRRAWRARPPSMPPQPPPGAHDEAASPALAKAASQ